MLLVDDEPEILLLMRAILARQGIDSTGAGSLGEARRNLAMNNYDGVILDVNLPDGKGYDLIPEIKRTWPHVRVIVISAMDQERAGSMKAGADAFLSKPMDRPTILQSLKDVGLSN